jgi:hypothetical protein
VSTVAAWAPVTTLHSFLPCLSRERLLDLETLLAQLLRGPSRSRVRSFYFYEQTASSNDNVRGEGTNCSLLELHTAVLLRIRSYDHPNDRGAKSSLETRLLREEGLADSTLGSLLSPGM